MRALLVCLFLSFAILNSALATVWPSDGSPSSVQFLHDNSAQDGDTITVPSGTYTWATPVIISKAITIQGVGSGVASEQKNNKAITWQTLPAGFQGPCPNPVTVTTATRIRNPSTAIVHGAGTNTLLVFVQTPNGTAQLTGMRFTSTSSNGYVMRNGPVSIQNCWFRQL